MNHNNLEKIAEAFTDEMVKEGFIPIAGAAIGAARALIPGLFGKAVNLAKKALPNMVGSMGAKAVAGGGATPNAQASGPVTPVGGIN